MSESSIRLVPATALGSSEIRVTLPRPFPARTLRLKLRDPAAMGAVTGRSTDAFPVAAFFARRATSTGTGTALLIFAVIVVAWFGLKRTVVGQSRFISPSYLM